MVVCFTRYTRHYYCLDTDFFFMQCSQITIANVHVNIFVSNSFSVPHGCKRNQNRTYKHKAENSKTVFGHTLICVINKIIRINLN